MTTSRSWRCPSCGAEHHAPVPINAYGHPCPLSRPHRNRHVWYTPIDPPDDTGQLALVGVA